MSQRIHVVEPPHDLDWTPIFIMGIAAFLVLTLIFGMALF